MKRKDNFAILEEYIRIKYSHAGFLIYIYYRRVEGRVLRRVLRRVENGEGKELFDQNDKSKEEELDWTCAERGWVIEGCDGGEGHGEKDGKDNQGKD